MISKCLTDGKVYVKSGTVWFLLEITYNPGINTQEAAVRIRSSARWALLCALLMCATQSNPSRALVAMFVCTPANIIHADVTNIEGKPAHILSPISSDLLPPSSQLAASNSLGVSDFAFKSSPAIASSDPAGCIQVNNISTLNVIKFISRNTFSETVENLFSCSA
jgi:hypothetical protein